MLEDKTISMLAHESAMARMEVIIKRLWILVIIIFIALILTNGAWIYYESQWEVVEETTTRQVISQDVDTGEFGDAVVAGIGDAFNGESEADRQTDNNRTEIPEKEEKVNE